MLVAILTSFDQQIKMKFLISLFWPLRVWQLLAVAPFEVTKQLLIPAKNTKLYYYAIVFLFVNIILLALCVIFSSTYIDWSGKNFTKFDDLLAMTIVRITSCIILGEAIFKENKQIEYFKQIICIDYVLHRSLHIRIDYDKYQFQNNLITAIWVFSLFICVISVTITTHMFGDPYIERFWAFYIGPLFVYSLNCHRMVLYVFVIRRRYQLLNQFIEKICLLQEENVGRQNIMQKLEPLSKINDPPIDSMAVQLICEPQLKDIRNSYQMLYEATKMINDLFLWSLPLCIAIDFHRLLVNTFYLFAVWLLQDQWLLLILAISWGGLNLAHLIVLSHACHTASKEVRSISLSFN